MSVDIPGGRVAGVHADDAAPARPTLSSVAALAGVSRQTVSNVLNSPELVREDTADRVRQAIAQVGYRTHLAARQLRTQRSNVLGLRIQATPSDGVFDRFLHALTDSAAQRDYRVMLYTADDDDAEIAAYSELLDRWQLDGFVLTATHADDRRTRHLAERNIPYVSFGRSWDDADQHSWADVDGAAGTRIATEHLLAAGHRKIGFFGWPEQRGVGNDRLTGWRDAMTDAGLPPGPIARSINDQAGSRAQAAELLDHADISALVCVSDVLALSVMAEASRRGLRVGRDIAITGFDDTDMAETVGLTSVHQPLTDAAATCVDLLTRALDPKRTTHAPQHVLLTPTLTVRASSSGGFATDIPRRDQP